MKDLMKLKTGMAVIASTTTWAAVPDITTVVRADQPRHTIPETLYGIFFENINYAADGGILNMTGSINASSAVSVGGASASGTPKLTGNGTINDAVTVKSAGGRSPARDS